MAESIPFSSVQINTPVHVYYCEPTWNWKPPRLKDFDLWYVVDGVGEIQLSGKAIPISSSSAIVFQPNSMPSAIQDLKRRLKVFVVHFDLFDQKHRKLKCMDEFPALGQRVRNPSFFSVLISKCETSYRKGRPMDLYQSQLCLQLMLLHLIEEAAAPIPNAIDERMQKLVNRLCSNPREWGRIETLASEVGLSKAQFVRRFRRATGFSPNHFMVKNRIDRACRLLEETDMSVKQVADALQYEDIYFFSKQFKAIKGYPPSSHQIRMMK